ncbi:hypothetical protein LVJ94_12175 [Pendulispora rubella]|uniref:Uncharacterized protein n=1 Tax=Pendulispora rubella TaxID=2741070 RepID=A0ABZ2LB39_9BACT
MDDLRTGLGLLFRAAKTAVDEFPTEKIEEAVKQGARDVGKVFETVGEAIDEKVLGRKKAPPPPGSGDGANAAPQAPPAAENAPPSPTNEEPKS